MDRVCAYALRGLCTCGHVRIRRCGQGLRLRSSWSVHVWSCADTAMWTGFALTLFVVCARVVTCGYGDVGRVCAYALCGLCTCGHVRIRRCGQGLRLRSSWSVHVWSCADTAMWTGFALTLFVVCARVFTWWSPDPACCLHALTALGNRTLFLNLVSGIHFVQCICRLESTRYWDFSGDDFRNMFTFVLLGSTADMEASHFFFVKVDFCRERACERHLMPHLGRQRCS